MVLLAWALGGNGCDESKVTQQSEQDWAQAREHMVQRQLRTRDIVDPRVLDAMSRTPRHRFVPQGQRSAAYDDRPLPVGHGQTISQPYIVALMSQLAAVGPGDRVLEIGTGSGYQAAVLAEMGAAVYTIEIVEPLGLGAQQLLRELGYSSIVARIGDGYAGWPEHAPFDAVVITAAPPAVPPPLKEQLAVGGRLVVPVGRSFQDLTVITRTAQGYKERKVLPVLFVPMTGRAQRAEN